jgi:hypothetical protein
MSMNRMIGLAWCVGLFWVCASVQAQSISISPANPQPGQTISITFSAPSSCNLNNPFPVVPPLAVGQTQTNFWFRSTSNAAILCTVNPPPFSYTTTLGSLVAGTYSVEWQDYLLGSEVFDVSLSFNVGTPASIGAPTMSWVGLSMLTLTIGALGYGASRYFNGRRAS